ncbi:hypothetical protein KVT40_003484 [Elsinoe batatas]|uniref:UBC core domain-containing protein n=1 Tax=Elsinoe batatas TaxID=2601811 RepID=A0A8K0L6Z6_9PEZI|nr:hypothetical protein KVT40_003484 [Elsinoe batatas]
MFFVWDLVEDKVFSIKGHVLATSADSDEFIATFVEEDPIITYHPALHSAKLILEQSEFHIPTETVLVKWRTVRFPELVPSSTLRLLNRQLLVGDLVVKASDGQQRGTVLKAETKCTIQTTSLIRSGDNGPSIPAHFDTLEEIKATEHGRRNEVAPVNQASVAGVERLSPPVLISGVDLYDLRTPIEHQTGDPVLYQDWAGIIRSTLDEVTVRLLNNTVVTLSPEVRISKPAAQTLYSTFHHGDLVAVKKSDLRLGRWLFGAYDPNTEPLGVVVEIRPIEMTVDWQSNRTLDISSVAPEDLPEEVIGLDEIESGQYLFYDMQHFTAHPSMVTDATEFTCDPDTGPICGPRVGFLNVETARAKYGNVPDSSRLFNQPRASNLGYDMNVFEVVDSRTSVRVQWQNGSITQEQAIDVIYADFTEEDLYPGDIVCTRETHLGPDGRHKIPRKAGVVQAVIADECIARVRWFSNPTLHLDTKEEYLALPDYLFGQLAHDVEALSIYDLVVPLGLDIGFLDSVFYAAGPYHIESGPADPNAWLGHVIENHMDATYTVRLGLSKQPRNVRASIDQISLALDPERVAEKEFMEQQEGYDEDGNPIFDPTDDMDLDPDSEEDDDKTDGVIMMGSRQETVEYLVDGQPMDSGMDNDSAWSTDDEAHGEPGDKMDISTATPSKQGEKITLSVPAYALLDSTIPAGHRYYEEKGALGNQTLRKVMKEHAILNSEGSMPAGIFVRSWESHCNLLRALIIGPSGTPYAECPFVFDILLPEGFPKKPPRFHFHHWTTGSFARNTKINPNLYEDGNVCLSLLNTWPGQETEGWIPGQSTLLQALISVQSLILVPEPFFNEPGYESKRDIPGTDTQSVAYNERVLLQSHGFLEHALSSVLLTKEDLSLEGLEDVIRKTYMINGEAPLLKKVIEDGGDMVRRSRAGDPTEMQKRDGISLISKGACQVLEKTLGNLKALLEADTKSEQNT